MFFIVSMLVFTGSSIAAQKPTLANYFYAGHFVLQRDVPNRIWGKAEQGECVTVRFSGVQATSQPATEEGYWEIYLPPLSACSIGKNLFLSIGGIDQAYVSDVLVGDVWLCMGQSNMERPLSETYDWRMYTKDAVNDVRFLKVKEGAEDVPMPDIPKGGWWRPMTEVPSELPAVPYFFARALKQADVEVPLGIVTVAVGGKRIENFMSPEMLVDNAIFSNEVSKVVAAGDTKAFSHWNAMLNPLRGIGIKGALWYQGENNVGQTSDEYYELLKHFVDGIRGEWGCDLPFYIVQLASYGKWVNAPSGEKRMYPDIREAQFRCYSKLDEIGLVATIDLFAHDAHPKAKVIIGDRIARWALRDVYGKDLSVVSGPIVETATYNAGCVRVEYKAETVGRALLLGYKAWNDNLPPVSVQSIGISTNLTGFAVSEDGIVWHWADGYIAKDNSIVVSNTLCATPRYVHYAQLNSCVGWSNDSLRELSGGVNLYNISDDGVLLPAVPFATIEVTPTDAPFPEPAEEFDAQNDSPHDAETKARGISVNQAEGTPYDMIFYGSMSYPSISLMQDVIECGAQGWIVITSEGSFLAAANVSDVLPKLTSVRVSEANLLVDIQNPIPGLLYGVSVVTNIYETFPAPDQWFVASSHEVLSFSISSSYDRKSCFCKVFVK